MPNSQHAVTITIDADSLTSYTDSFLATAWHVAQANPAPFDDKHACELAEQIGREIIRRFLDSIRPELWMRQGTHVYTAALGKHCRWDGEQWVARTEAATATAHPAPAAAPACTDDSFATVPQVTLPNGVTVPSFQVSKYLCAEGDNGQIAIAASSTPWVRINYREAKGACEASGCMLITELQMLALAHDIAQQDINWTGGKVGKGALYQGLHRGTVSGAQAGDYVSPKEDERRWFQLSNGERIFDVAGNAYTWVFDDVQGDKAGLIARPFAEDSPSITTAPFPRMEKGVGWYPEAGANWSRLALLRGGYWASGANAGVFLLSSGWPGSRDGYVGFRCTK